MSWLIYLWTCTSWTGLPTTGSFTEHYEGVDSVDLLGPILEKYQVSRQMFDTTMYQYSRFPEIFDQVYNDVLTKLNIMLDENDLECDQIAG